MITFSSLTSVRTQQVRSEGPIRQVVHWNTNQKGWKLRQFLNIETRTIESTVMSESNGIKPGDQPE